MIVLLGTQLDEFCDAFRFNDTKVNGLQRRRQVRRKGDEPTDGADEAMLAAQGSGV
jgi:hypothetical protein